MYAAPADVAQLIKNLDSLSLVDAPEIKRALAEAGVDILSMLGDYYRTPFQLDPTKYLFNSTLSGNVAGGATTIPLTAVSVVSALDGRTEPIRPGDRIWLDPATAIQESAIVDSLSGLTCTLRFPVGRIPVVQSGLLFAHPAAGSLVIKSTGLDTLLYVETRLAMSKLMETQFNQVDEYGKNIAAMYWRKQAEAIETEVSTGKRQLIDLIPGASQPLYPTGTPLGTDLTWDGSTYNAPGHPDFTKERGVIFVNGEFV